MRKKRDGISFAVFCAALLIGSLLAGCTTALEPQETQPTEPAYSTETPTAAEKTQPARSEDDLAEVSLASFRQAMVGTPQLFGVAYFGDTTQALDQPVNPFSVMQEAAPQLCEDLPFLLAVPEGNVVGISGQLYCIVPADENATVAVNGGVWSEEHEAFECDEVIYRSERGDPILLLCNDSGWETNTLVTVTDSDGNVAVWQPHLDSSCRVAPLCDDNGASLLYDFSPYDALLTPDDVQSNFMSMVSYGWYQRASSGMDG